MKLWITEAVRLKPLYYATIGIVVLILISAIFRPSLAAILSLALIGLWSRIPCMYNELSKDLEILDFCTFIVAINLGGLTGAIFGSTVFAFSSLFAKYEDPMNFIQEVPAFFVCGLAMPLVYGYTGNLLLSMYSFTAIRYAVILLVTFAIYPPRVMLSFQYLAFGAMVAYVTNTAMITFFGDITTRLLATGVGLDMKLVTVFSVVTLYLFLTQLVSGEHKKPDLELHRKQNHNEGMRLEPVTYVLRS